MKMLSYKIMMKKSKYNVPEKKVHCIFCGALTVPWDSRPSSPVCDSCNRHGPLGCGWKSASVADINKDYLPEGVTADQAWAGINEPEE
jgi:hypothetical protein